jgi:hypothetical protein
MTVSGKRIFSMEELEAFDLNRVHKSELNLILKKQMVHQYLIKQEDETAKSFSPFD